MSTCRIPPWITYTTSMDTHTLILVSLDMNCMTLEVIDYDELDWVLIPSREIAFLFATTSRLSLVPDQLPMQWAPLTWSLQLTSISCQKLRIRGATSPLLLYSLSAWYLYSEVNLTSCVIICIITAFNLIDGHTRLEEHTDLSRIMKEAVCRCETLVSTYNILRHYNSENHDINFPP
jgi:hypothetical protein